MKKYIKYIGTIIIFTFSLFEIIVLSILTIPANKFYSTYQSLIQDKYRILVETDEPKIIMISGSSSAFGLNQKMLEEESGYKVANLGLHAGFGHLFHSELAKANINEGDIVLLGYEYDWINGFTDLDLDLVMTGIDNNIEMYKYIPVDKWDDIIGNLSSYAELKNTIGESTGIYSREAFDSETGQMTWVFDDTMEWNAEYYGTVDLSDVSISDDAIEYLTAYKVYVEKQGASVYFVAPPLIKDAVICNYEEFDRLKELEERLIGIPYISDPKEYLYSADLMSNANFHCNSKGRWLGQKCS